MIEIWLWPLLYVGLELDDVKQLSLAALSLISGITDEGGKWGPRAESTISP
jgi:hypothetical protein